MDNRSEDDGPMYIPARRNFGIGRYASGRGRNRFSLLKVLLTAVAFVALVLVGRFLLVEFFITDYLHVGHQVARSMMAMGQKIQLRDKAMEEGGTVDGATHSIVFSGPFGFPLSPLYRLQGEVQSVGSVEYLATSSHGAYILIPAKDCRLVNGGPYCKYHGTTVTRSSGVQ